MIYFLHNIFSTFFNEKRNRSIDKNTRDDKQEKIKDSKQRGNARIQDRKNIRWRAITNTIIICCTIPRRASVNVLKKIIDETNWHGNNNKDWRNDGVNKDG